MDRPTHRSLQHPASGGGLGPIALSVWRRWTLALLLTGLACTPAGPVRPELAPLLDPDLSEAEPSVQQQIGEQREALDALLEDRSTALPELAKAFGDQGLLYVTYGFFDAAERCIENARRLAPNDHAWPHVAGFIHQLQGRLPEAKDAFEAALAARPDYLPSHIRMGRLWLEMGDASEAQAHFRRARKLDAGSAAAWEGLGRTAAAAGEIRQAVEHYERALELQPTAASLRQALGLAYRELGELEKAREQLERAGEALVLFEDPVLTPIAVLGRSKDLLMVRGAQAFGEMRYAEAATFFGELLERDPANLEVRQSLALCYERLGDREEAVRQIEIGLGQPGDGSEKDTLRRSEMLRFLGTLHSGAGRPGDAINAFERAVDIAPETVAARIQLGNALARVQRFRAALAQFDRVLELQPDDLLSHLQRATVLVNLGRDQEARAAYLRAIELAPERPELRLRYADALEHLGDRQEADRQRRAATDAALDDGQKAAVLLGEASRKTRAEDYEGALEDYRQALELTPGETQARYEMAALLGHLGRFDEAITAFAQVLDAEPRHRQAHHGLVTALLLQERWGEARQGLEKGLQMLPADRSLTHALTRLLASSPAGHVRDGRQALALAMQIQQSSQHPETAATVAMALAEAGRYDEARMIQRQLVDAAGQAGQPTRAATERRRLEAYEGSRPWRATSPDEIITALRLSLGG